MEGLKEHLILLKRLIKLVTPLSGFMGVAILMGSLGHLVAIGIPSLSTWALANLFEGKSISLQTVGLLLVVFGFSRGIFHYVEQLANHYIAFKILALIRNEVFAVLRKLAPAKLETKDSGSMIAVITSDIELLEVFYAHTISPLGIAFVVCSTIFAMLWHYHYLYALLAGVIYFVLAFVIPIVTYTMGRMAGDQQRIVLSQLNNIVLDTFRGIKECIQFRYKDKALGQISEEEKKLAYLSKKLSDYMGFNFGVSFSVVILSYIGFTLLGAWLYESAKVGVEGFIVPIVLVLSSYGPTLALANLANNMMLTFACGRRVFALLDELPVVKENETGEAINFENLEIRDVDFSYGDKKILSDINLSLKKNEILGIRGKSGQGKSTLLKLIMRYYDPDKGVINLNEVSLLNLTTSSLRENQSFVAQETYLFKDTIRQNLLVAKPNASDEDLDEACRKANIYDFIRTLPKGYDTYAGELGERFSMGEKQRLGLARAFLHDAPLMLLDEPTANIDSLNEGAILRALDRERDNKAICIVSHRPSTFSIVERFIDIKNLQKG